MEKNNYKKLNFKISDEEFKLRIKKITDKMAEENLELLILSGDEFAQGYIRYVSDYRPILENALVLIGVNGESLLLCGPECKTLAFNTSRIKNIKVCSDVAIPGEDYPNEEMVSLMEILKEYESKNKINRIGVADLDFIPNFLINSITKVNIGKDIINSANIINKIRGVKSKEEIVLLKGLYESSIKSCKRGLENLDVGKTETEIAAEISYPLWKMGAEQMSHTFLVASGINTTSALMFPSGDKVIKEGDLVILDIGAVYKGYYSDIATTKIIGKGGKDKEKVLNIVRKAKESAIKKIKPGIKGKEIDLAAREITSNAGYGKNHLYGVCHGVGLQHCEYPFFGPNSETIVEEGMFFTVDIGLFNFEFGGVRLEDGIVVKGGGCEVFTIEED